MPVVERLSEDSILIRKVLDPPLKLILMMQVLCNLSTKVD